MYAEIARDTLASEDVDDSKHEPTPAGRHGTLPGRGGTEDVIIRC
jgi:hypothetical protein